uniref:Uncharacterized protein n=1 Tax=Vespula pensylvanica TaxID=30213 RepID=A0A834N4C2_VESPE|nr:hypothetical protein H0235_017084 [Vespula pensylvanica]
MGSEPSIFKIGKADDYSFCHKGNKIKLSVLNEEHWIDTDGSESYWFVISSDSCGFNDVLYEGSAVKLTSAVMTEGLLKDFHNFSIYKSTATV